MISVVVVFALYTKQYNVKITLFKELESDLLVEESRENFEDSWTFSANYINESDILWWTVIRCENDINDKKKMIPTIYSVNFSEIDFDNYNAVICVNRKINKIQYVKSTYFPFFPKNNGLATVHFSKEYMKNKIYVYLIKKDEPLRVEYKLPMEVQCVIDS